MADEAALSGIGQGEALDASTNRCSLFFPDLVRGAMNKVRSDNPALLLLPVYVSGIVCAALLQLAQFGRAGPFGTPYVVDPGRYLPAALFYECYGMSLVLVPFLLLGFIWRSPAWRRGLFAGAAIAVGILLIIGHVNHELQRFMGIRLSSGFLALYAKGKGMPPAILQALADDTGGTWLSVALLAVPLGLYPWLVVRLARLDLNLPPLIFRMVAAGSFIGLFLLPALSWHVLPGGGYRMDKVAPAILAVAREIEFELHRRPVDLALLRADARWFQAGWLAAELSGRWAFPDPRYPYWRTCQKAAPVPAHRPNIILIVVETLRAKNMRSFLPSAPQAPTPFLDALAAAPGSASWTRYYTNGVPTAPAMLTIGTSVPPPGFRQYSATAAHAHFDGFPGILRDSGYRTVTFAVGDPDWDNQTYWLRKWFDEIHFDPRARKVDRIIFRRMAHRLIALGKQDRPFFAMIKSYSNHLPFRSPEARFDVGRGKGLKMQINGTMAYSDDVIREFHGALAGEPWFRDAIFVVTGDHGYDLGDRGVAQGHTNLRRETTWVPLIMHRTAGLPLSGRQATVGSHVDLGPTILDLAGLCPSLASSGHSLFAVDPDRASALIVNDGNVALETARYSLFLPADRKPMLYRGDDLLQLHDIAAQTPDIVRELSTRARVSMRLNDALISTDSIRPAAGSFVKSGP